MVILHIAAVRNTSVSGMDVAVPMHVNAQSNFARVGFVNVEGEWIPAIKEQFPYKRGFLISALPEPFCKPDLIVFHEVYKPPYLKLYRQAKKLGVPYVIFPQGCLTTVAQRKRRLKKAVANRLFFNAFIRGAIAIQFLSEWERDKSQFGEKKIIGTHGMRHPSKKNRGSASSGVEFIYIGRMEVHIKGLDLMLQAIQKIAVQLRECKSRFFLYGPDFEGGHAEIRRLIDELGVGDLVELSGPVIGDEKEKKLLNADIFIQTSRTDGFPLGVLEAMSYGVPCLVTEGTSYGAIASEHDVGWVAQTDAGSIAETILKALQDREQWETKRLNCIHLVEENYTWEEVAQNILKQYKELLL